MKIFIDIELLNGSQGMHHTLRYTNGNNKTVTISGDKYTVAKFFETVLDDIRKEHKTLMAIGVK